MVGRPVLFGQLDVLSSVVYPSSGGLSVPSPLSPFNPQDAKSFGSGNCPLAYNDTTGQMQVRVHPITSTMHKIIECCFLLG